VSWRYSRLAKRMGVVTTIHKLRHYSATELIAAGVDVRTVAGRLGHGGGGTTTLRVYAAWVSEADQRAAAGLMERLPERPQAAPGMAAVERVQRNPYELVAADLRAHILDGRLPAGALLPSRKEIARTYNIAVGTAHRAVVLLGEWGLVDVRAGRRAVVISPADSASSPRATAVVEVPAADIAPAPAPAAAPVLVELELRRGAMSAGRWTTAVESLDAAVLECLLRDAIRRSGTDDTADSGAYELVVRQRGIPEPVMTFVSTS